ncbi:MAG: Ger(x)C family spore germination protein [Tepidanaerobacteraceae bacterium]|jgi:Ger(x)C family germination protein|nr:Ger(x)C family spore germination protein [Tepidanaerobacteraceae bacterium]
MILSGKFFRRCLLFLLAALAFAFATACWDYRDIDKRIFVGGVGIDKSAQDGRLEISFLIPVVRAIAGGEGGGGGGGGGEKPVIVESTIADTITEGARNLALRLNRDLFFEHMRIVIIGEEAARQGMEEIINPFMRQTEFNRRSRIAISEGEAGKIMGIKTTIEKLPSAYLESIYGNASLSGKFVEGDLGDFLHQIHESGGNALVGKVIPGADEVNIGGGAVVKHFKLAGWLSEEEIQGINFFLGKITGGSITVDDPRGKGKCTFVMLNAHRRLQLISAGAVPEFQLKVLAEGNVVETTEGVSMDVQDEEIIERLVSEKIRTEIFKGIARLQNDYRVDLLKLGEFLHRYHPKLWRNYEDRWEDIFPDVRISVSVTADIKNIGVTK